MAEMMQIYSQKAHYHEEELEIILVLKGSITIHKIQRSVTIHENELTLLIVLLHIVLKAKERIFYQLK